MTSDVHPRPFSSADAVAVLTLAARTYTPDSRWHLGDLAWHLATTQGLGLGDHTAVWSDAASGSQGVVAVSWWDRIHVADEVRAAATFVGPAALLPDVVAHTVEGLDRSVSAVDVVVLDVERDLAEALRGLGFVPVEHDEFFVNLQCDLSALPETGASGDRPFAVRRADAFPPQAWVDLHRAVWPDSSLTVAGREALVRRWPYDPELDLVAVADDGTLVGSVLGWLDPGGTTGQLEPVGTLPQWRRQGVSRAVGGRVLRAFRDAGASRALVYARGDDAYPVPRAVYTAMGFTQHARQQRWQLRLDGPAAAPPRERRRGRPGRVRCP